MMHLSKHTLNVSIHAPAQGATSANCPTVYFTVVSIHAPAQGATSSTLVSDLLQGVSIHAPAQGATY